MSKDYYPKQIINQWNDKGVVDYTSSVYLRRLFVLKNLGRKKNYVFNNGVK